MSIEYSDSVRYYLDHEKYYDAKIVEFNKKVELVNSNASSPAKIRQLGFPFLNVVYENYDKEINYLGKYFSANNSLVLAYYRNKYYQSILNSRKYRVGFQWGFSTIQTYGGFIAGICIEQGFGYEDAKKLYNGFVKHELLHSKRLEDSGLDKMYPNNWKNFQNCFLVSLVYNLKLNRIEYLPEFYFQAKPNFEKKLVYSKVYRDYIADIFEAMLFSKSGKVKPSAIDKKFMEIIAKFRNKK